MLRKVTDDLVIFPTSRPETREGTPIRPWNGRESRRRTLVERERIVLFPFLFSLYLFEKHDTTGVETRRVLLSDRILSKRAESTRPMIQEFTSGSSDLGSVEGCTRRKPLRRFRGVGDGSGGGGTDRRRGGWNGPSDPRCALINANNPVIVRRVEGEFRGRDDFSSSLRGSVPPALDSMKLRDRFVSMD